MAVVALLGAAAGYAVWHTSTGNNVELQTIDARFALRGDRHPWPGVVVVGIDDQTIETSQYGSFPFKRSWDARLIDTLRRDGARTIAVDLLFEHGTDNADDLALYDAAKRAHGHIVLAGTATDARGDTYVLGGVANQRAAGIAVGSAYFPEDTDGSVRRIPAAVEHLQSFAGAIARTSGIGASALAGDFTGGYAWIDFPGPARTVPIYSFAGVLGPSGGLPRAQWVPPSAVRGKIVIVGATANSLQDRHTVGGWASQPMSGPEIEADAVATLMNGAALRPLSLSLEWLELALAALLLPALAIVRLRWTQLLALFLVAAAAVMVSAQLAFDGGVITLVMAPLAALLVSGAGAVLIPLAIERRELRTLRERFARFDPSVVDAVLSDPGIALRVRAMAIGPESVIAGYRLVSLVGRGGMGVVYEAVQLTLGRHVALKLIDPMRVDDEELRARFVRESHIAAALEHPHVIPVYEAREDSGLLFIAMRLVQGPSLADVLATSAPLPAARAATIVAQIASALGAAHAQGLVHRDVKPANVLLYDGEHAYLTDFGITRELAAGDGLTAVGERIGTVDYMSPEQCRGEPVGPAGDIYALGCVLYEALTGRVPFPGESEAQRLAGHLQQAPPVASEHWAAVPAALDAVIVTALAKLPEERQRSAEAFAAAVLHAAGVEPPPAPAPAAPGGPRVTVDQPTLASG